MRRQTQSGDPSPGVAAFAPERHGTAIAGGRRSTRPLQRSPLSDAGGFHLGFAVLFTGAVIQTISVLVLLVLPVAGLIMSAVGAG